MSDLLTDTSHSLQQLDATDKSIKVCLLGAPTICDNRGCRALTMSLITLIREATPDADIFTLEPTVTARKILLEEKHNIKQFGYTIAPRLGKLNFALAIALASMYRITPTQRLRKKLFEGIPFMNVLMRADLVCDIREGDSFSDIYGIKRLLSGSVPAIAATIMKKKLVLLPQTYGPYTSPAAKSVARRVISRSKLVLSRDSAGLQNVKEFLGHGKKVSTVFCPDVAFCLNPVKPDVLPSGLQNPSDPRPTMVGVNISALLYHGGYSGNNMFGLALDYKSFITQLLGRFLNKPNTHVMLIPHVYGSACPEVENDLTVCRKLYEELSARCDNISVVDGDYTEGELKWIIGQCDFMIGSRMHACIAAISQCIPTIGVAYSPKFGGVFESAGLGEWIVDARSVCEDESLKLCEERFEDRENIKPRLTSAMTTVKSRIRSCFSEEILNA